MQTRHVLISGASIAGPALAYWLRRHGYRVTVVERAPALREGGQAVDFRGATHMQVLERMGILEAIRRAQTHMRETALIDATGKTLFCLPALFMSGDVEIERGDLSRILYEATKDEVEYVFGESIASLSQHEAGVAVTFASGAARSFDLVVGADGLHSGVRNLAFGDESQFMRFHGYYAAGFSAPNHLGLDHRAVIFSVPKLGVSVASAHHREQARVLFVFAAPPLDCDRRDIAQQKKIVTDAYAQVGWEVPQLLTALQDASDLYFDSISQVDLDHYAVGRVVLLGDAAYGGTLGGQGSGLAVVGAYVLAGELASAHGDHRAAFARYQQRMRAYARTCQKGSKHVGPFYAPPNRAQHWLRNQVYGAMASRPLSGLLEKLVTSSATALSLPEYPLVSAL